MRDRANSDNATITLRECDREPVHIPGRIQAYGILLVLNPATQRVVQTGGDLLRWLGRSPQDTLNAPVWGLFSPESKKSLETLFETATQQSNAIAMLQPAQIPELTLAATVHMSGGLALLELEDANLAPRPDISLLQQYCAEAQETFHRTKDIQTLWNQGVQYIRRMTGFDRVMLYTFHQDFSGEVTAESMVERLEPFLGHRYPASDIPEPARKLYLHNWLRAIPDVNVEQPLIYPQETEGRQASLDMTHCRLRAVSPIHIEYLKNMGVASSLSLSILVDGKLWGLIACHHYEGPLFFSLELQRALVLITRCFCTTLSVKLAQNAFEIRLSKGEKAAAIQASITGSAPLERLLRHISKDLMRLVDASGLALVVDDHVSAMGRTPNVSQIQAITRWLESAMQGDVYASHTLSKDIVQAEKWKDTAAGLLALRLGGRQNTFIMWFRPEVVVEELWGGDPAKPYTMNPESGSINPRTSFNTFKLQIKGASTPWTSHDTYAVRSLVPALNAHMIRIAESVLRRSEKRFRELVTFNPEPQVVFSQSGEVLYLNPAAISSLGSHKPNIQTLAGMTCQDPTEVQLAGQSSSMWAEVRCIDVHWEEEPARLVSLHDITERKHMEQLKEDVQRITRHDLISPLNPIINAPQALLEDDNLRDEQKELLQSISDAGQRMQRMIDLSLNLYKMEQGVFSYLPVQVNVVSVIRDILADQSRHINQIKVNIDLRIDGLKADSRSSFFIIGDAALCYSMLSNLILNALEASDKNGAVDISLQSGPEGCISIHNSQAVPEAIKDLFFEKYVTHGKAKGTGLGTYSAWLIANTMGGSIELHSSPKQGATVTVRLPMDTAKRPPALSNGLPCEEPPPARRQADVADQAVVLALSRLKQEIEAHAYPAVNTSRKTALLFEAGSSAKQQLDDITSSLARFDYPKALQLLNDLLQDLGVTL